MLTLSLQPSPRRPIELGAIIRLTVERRSDAVEVRVFLRQGPVLYPRPLVDWSKPAEPILIYPESPGAYAVEAHWREPGGEEGRTQIEFSMHSPEAGERAGPARVELEHFSLWTPSAFEAQAFSKTDREVGRLLAKLVRRGQTVYDLGANVGFFAAHFARLVGRKGRVVCLEANPVCAYFLRSNLLELGHEHAVVVPAAVLHVDGMTRFLINQGNTNLGVVEASGFYHHKPGQEIVVSCFSLDRLVSDLGLPAPDLVKVDVEGAELWVLDGMARTLERHRPTLLLELHGEACTQGAITRLAERGYRFEDATSGEVYGGESEALAALGGDSVYQLIARPGAAD